MTQNQQSGGWSFIVLLRINYLDWENWRLGITKEDLVLKTKNSQNLLRKKKGYKKEEGEEPQAAAQHKLAKLSAWAS